jgi:hypothetical protein
VDAGTAAYLDADDAQSCFFEVGERLVPLDEAADAMAAFVSALMGHLDEVLARLDAGDRGRTP